MLSIFALIACSSLVAAAGLSDNDDCPVCLTEVTEISPYVAQILPCHPRMFHEHCIRSAFHRGGRKCPLCRNPAGYVGKVYLGADGEHLRTELYPQMRRGVNIPHDESDLEILPYVASSPSATVPGEQGNIVLRVLRMSMNSYRIEVNPKSSVYEVKQLIQSGHGVPVQSQKLIFNRRELEDNELLSELEGLEGSGWTLHMVLKL